VKEEDLNELLMSHSATDILKFYSEFNDQEQLVHWMMMRSSAPAEIYQINGEGEIVVVIPTMSHKSKNSEKIANVLFKEIPIIFVESGSDSRLFNYARNCNLGIKAALEYEPKWIIISNDDMQMIDEPRILVNSLSHLKARYDNISAVYASPSSYHSYPIFLGYPNLLRHFYFYLRNKETRTQVVLERKFGIDIVVQYFGKLQRNLFTTYTTIMNMGDFCIFSSEYIKQIGGKLFDEVYINEFEEVELSYILAKSGKTVEQIPYRIGDKIGTSLGVGSVRRYRAIASRSYFNYKVKKKLIDFKPDQKCKSLEDDI